MPTHHEYLLNILQQIIDSVTLLESLPDKPGDLDIIKREHAKIVGLMISISHRMNDSQYTEYLQLLDMLKLFTSSFDFSREINTMSELYSDDPHRLHNIRFKILDALNTNNLIELIKKTLRDLSN
ncbi:MAG: hypothetical protein R1F52_00855 [Candidatus Nitrosoabyssus spongiisocia]|nr:MAG: hypothetical protein R1F52_00855 [Nitrosopumilaceae archaeon AB1(1)]